MTVDGKRQLCRSHPPRCGPSSFFPQQYTHWLPENVNPPQDSDETALGDTCMEDYEEFDGLVHATHIETSGQIATDGKISGRSSDDSTVANHGLALLEQTTIPPEYACIHHTKTCWVAPNSELSPRFGPVVFNLNLYGTGGILDEDADGNNFTYYFLEVIDYHKSQSASRIFVVPTSLVDKYKDLDHLRYDPTVRGGPWYWDSEADKHYALKQTTAFDPFSSAYSTRKHTLEFLRYGDFEFPYDIKSWYIVPHDNCKRFRSKCRELDIPKTEAFLRTWALMRRFLQEWKWYYPHRSTHELAYKELDDDDDDDNDNESLGAALFKTLDSQPRVLEEELASQVLNWKIFLSCLRDDNFHGAYAVARKIPNATLNDELPSQFHFETQEA
ncbi:hypothetical protein DFS34DRAFT_638544 [Phlyctochytrium arcticum]|nr:hypothetical protein DFS34DRAFT_638544 [Phlyctochytrium arcticum]